MTLSSIDIQVFLSTTNLVHLELKNKCFGRPKRIFQFHCFPLPLLISSNKDQTRPHSFRIDLQSRCEGRGYLPQGSHCHRNTVCFQLGKEKYSKGNCMYKPVFALQVHLSRGVNYSWNTVQLDSLEQYKYKLIDWLICVLRPIGNIPAMKTTEYEMKLMCEMKFINFFSKHQSFNTFVANFVRSLIVKLGLVLYIYYLISRSWTVSYQNTRYDM